MRFTIGFDELLEDGLHFTVAQLVAVGARCRRVYFPQSDAEDLLLDIVFGFHRGKHGFLDFCAEAHGRSSIRCRRRRQTLRPMWGLFVRAVRRSPPGFPRAKLSVTL